MQVKTEILIENIILTIIAIAVFYIALQFTTEDSDTDTDFPKQDNTIEVHIKQFGRADMVVYRECVLLAERVEC